MAGGSQRGLALVIVLTVLLALVIIGTPFVLSMVLQEKGATAQKEQKQADYGADGVRNYAAWRLMRGHDSLERRAPAPPWATYYADGPSEFQVRPADHIPPATASNLKGAIWGVNIQDEQGKINVTTAPAAVLNRFVGPGLVDSRLVDLKDFLTLYSGRDARWIFPQRIRGIGNVQIDPNDPKSAIYGIRVDSAQHYGGRLRVSHPDRRTLEVAVTRNWVASGYEVVETNPQVPDAYAGGIAEVETRHPVNLNTARREVLIAIFEGLRLLGSPDPAISRDAAAKLADRFYRKPVDRIESFLARLLTANEITNEQKVAVAINAVNPFHFALAGTGTMPLTFKSYDVVTLEAFSSLNAPTGVETAGRGFREVVSVCPPLDLNHELESQFDFDIHYRAAVAVGNAFSGLPQMTGYPFGGKIITAPNLLPLLSDTALKPQQTPQTESWIQVAPARDLRGTAAILNFREHFDNTLEGSVLNGGTLSYRWDQIFAPYPQGAVPPQQMPDVAAGGIEMWVRFDAAGSVSLFDVRQSDSTNRVSVHYDAATAELILTLADGTLGDPNVLIDNGTAQIRFPFAAAPDRTWYHIGAYWKGTRFAHAALLVDGFAHPNARFMHYSPENRALLTRLSAALSDSATNWQLEDNSMIPANEISYWLVGSEVIGTDGSQLFRGLRGTAAQAHPARATVQIFGYSSRLRNTTVTCNFAQFGKAAAGSATLTYDRLTRGGGRVSIGFGANPTATVLGNKTDPITNQTYIDETQSTIPVVSPAIADYPATGHLMIEDEVVYYTGLDVPGNRFTGCVRGQHGTVAARHNTGAQVRMWGIAASDTTNYLSPTVIQIDNEWFGPVYRDPDHPNHWIGHVNAGIPGPLLRGAQVFQTIPSSHAANAEIIPTFAVRETDPSVTRRNLGPGDRVTITDALVQSEYKRLCWAAEQGNGWQISVGQGQLAAFLDNVPRDYVADEMHVRVLKFPSGELLGMNFLQAQNPQCTIGPARITVDEFKVFASPKGNFLNAATVDENGTTVVMNSTSGISNSGGAIKIGNEIVGFTTNANNTLAAVRGFLNSPAEVHDAGDFAFNLSFLPIATLAVAAPATSPVIQVTAGSAANAINNPEGYVLIRSNGRDEVLMYTGAYGQGPITLTMPTRVGSMTDGLFRGMFGTQAIDHDANTLVYFPPFRFWDTYKPAQWDNRMCYYQATASMEAALWKSVTWVEEEPAKDKNLRTHVLVRIDGVGEWFDAPGKDLFDFTQPNGKNPIDRIGYRNDPGQLDLRIGFEYRGGFWPEHSWKRATRVKHVRVLYNRPTRVLYHEDK